MKLKILLIFFVTLLNFWIWRIFQFNPWVGILAVVDSFLLTFLFLEQKYTKKILLVLLFLTLIQTWLIRTDINFKLEDPRPEEILQQHERKFYYTQDLGKLFLNKISLNYYQNYDLFFYKLQRNFFYILDPNLYFFGGHPRERGTYEFEKFPFIYLPFFIAGFLFLILKIKKITFIYIFISLILSTFINPAFRLGPVFLFPLVTSLVGIGFIKIIFRK